MKKWREFKIHGAGPYEDQLIARIADTLPEGWEYIGIEDTGIVRFHEFINWRSERRTSLALVFRNGDAKVTTISYRGEPPAITPDEYRSILNGFVAFAEPAAHSLGLTTEEE